jgi:hypothetical protein
MLHCGIESIRFALPRIFRGEPFWQTAFSTTIPNRRKE